MLDCNLEEYTAVSPFPLVDFFAKVFHTVLDVYETRTDGMGWKMSVYLAPRRGLTQDLGYGGHMQNTRRGSQEAEIRLQQKNQQRLK